MAKPSPLAIAKRGLLASGPAVVPAAMLLAALSVLLPTSACADKPIGGPALGFGLEVGAGLARSPYWPLKEQFWLSPRLSLEIPLADLLALGLSVAFRYTADSDVAAGFLYRGHHGLEAAACLLFRPTPAADRPNARVGIAVGGSASFDVYNRTELLFFYPSLTAEPCLELPIEGPPKHTFGFGLPFRLDYRKDMELSASVGLSVRWRWYPKWKQEGA